MTWYWVLLIIIGSQGAVLLVWWLLEKRGNDLGALLDKLEKSTVKRLDEERKAERKAKKTIAAAYRSLSARQKKITEWYNVNKTKIDAEATSAFEKLAGDPAIVDSKLDELLGSSAAEDDTVPGLPVDPASTVGEG